MDTKLVIKNSSNKEVEVWVTLGATPGCLQDVSKIPFITKVLSNLVGSFKLGSRKSTMEYSPANLGFNGNLSFNSQPQNCPSSPGGSYPNGVNLFEFILNNEFQSGAPQETVDISCVAGVNCAIRADLGGDEWNAGPTMPRVLTIENGPIGTNTGRVGVFPVGCDDCTASVSPPSCPNPPSYETPQANAICNVQRVAKHHGGIVEVIYLGAL
jgi:hypothetical protein